MHVQVSWEAIEEAFWNIVEEGEEDVEVLYGADLDSTIFGSAFPTRNGRMCESKYADAPWNLNNVPRLPGAFILLHSSITMPFCVSCNQALCFADDHKGQSQVWPGNLILDSPGHLCLRCSVSWSEGHIFLVSV